MFGTDGAFVLTTANADSETQSALGWHLHGDGGSSWTLVLAMPGLPDALFAPGDRITLRGMSPTIAAAPDEVECVWPQPGAGRLHAVRFARGAETVTLGTGEVGPLGELIVVNGYYHHLDVCADCSSSWIWGAYAAAGGPL